MFRSMFGLGVALLVIALIAAVFGFGFVSSTFMDVAKILFFAFLVLAVLAILGGSFGRRWNP